MPRKKKRAARLEEVVETPPQDALEVEPLTPEPEIVDEVVNEVLEEAPPVDVEKLKLQIFKDSIVKLVAVAPEVLAVRDNPILYGEFLHALRRSLN